MNSFKKYIAALIIFDFIAIIFLSISGHAVSNDGLSWANSLKEGLLCNIDNPHLRFSSCLYQAPVSIINYIFPLSRIQFNFLFSLFSYSFPIICYIIGLFLSKNKQSTILISALYFTTIPMSFVYPTTTATDSIALFLIFWPIFYSKSTRGIQLLVASLAFSISLILSYETSILFIFPLGIAFHQKFKDNLIPPKVFHLLTTILSATFILIALNIFRIYINDSSGAISGFSNSLARILTEMFIIHTMLHLLILTTNILKSRKMWRAGLSVIIFSLLFLSIQHHLYNQGRMVMSQFDQRIIAIPFAISISILSLFFKFSWSTMLPIIILSFMIKLSFIAAIF